MMKSAGQEGPPSDFGPGALPALNAAAERITASIDDLITRLGLTGDQEAASLLNLTPNTIMDMITGGDLDGVVTGGRAWVNPAALHLHVIEHAELGVARTREARALARTALHGFLAARPVTGSWAVARDFQRPLVCRRRGQNWLRHGVEFHHVVLNARWVGRWAGTVGIFTAPELAAMPVGSHLCALLEDLPGVESVSSATPLIEDGPGVPSKPHGVNGWVRVIPDHWALTVPDDVAAALAPPREVR